MNPNTPELRSTTSIEEDIATKGKTAPRVTPRDIEDNIRSEFYFTASEAIGLSRGDQVSLDLLTFCVLVTKNGFTVTGQSACASPENYDEGIGMKIARQNAVNNLWQPMGYALKERLYQMTQPAQDPDGSNGPDSDGGEA